MTDCKTQVDELNRSTSNAPFCEACKVRSLAVCAALDRSELRELDSLARRIDVPPKKTILHEGDEAAAVYSVTAGVVRIYKLLSQGRRQVLGFALPGDFIGLALRNRYGFTADAVDHVRLCRFDRREFEQLLSRKPRLLSRLHSMATHELVIAQDQMALLGRRTADERVAMFILSMRDRWAKIAGKSATVELPMTRLDIADHLGITIETVSRTITKLARQRLIINGPNAVRILDEQRFAEICR